VQYSELLTLIGDLTNDPGSDRYTSAMRATELDNSQDKWNVGAKIIKDTVTLTVVDGTRQYAISGLTGTPIAFPRVTHRGIELDKKSKTYIDLYTASDWTVDVGTPSAYFIEITDPDLQYITVHPTPQSVDAGANLVIEYIKRHTAMSATTDVPFMSGTSSNPLLRPYDWGLAYDVSARLLARDPSAENTSRAVDYSRIAGSVLADVVQVFKALEQEEPMRMRGGRYF
jgi:hypothetical protein